MSTSSYKKNSNTFSIEQVTQPAIANTKTLNCYPAQAAPVNKNLKPVTEAVESSDREIVLETTPEVVVIMGYAEFGDQLEIYSGRSLG